MNSEIIAFAFGAKCGARGVQARAAGSRRAWPARRRRAARRAGAGAPARRSRRRSGRAGQEVAAAREARVNRHRGTRSRPELLAEVGQRGEFGVLRLPAQGGGLRLEEGGADAQLVRGRRAQVGELPRLVTRRAPVGDAARVRSRASRPRLRTARAATCPACFRTKSLFISISACGAVVVALRRSQLSSPAGRVERGQERDRLAPPRLEVDAAARLVVRRADLPGRVLDHGDRRPERRAVEPARGDQHAVAHGLGFEPPHREPAVERVRPVGRVLAQRRGATTAGRRSRS